MKICYLAPAASVHTARWAAYMAGRGHQVTVYTFHPGAIAGVRVEQLPRPLPAAGKLNYLLVAPRLARLLKREQPDLLHAHYLSSYGLVADLSGYRPRVISVWGSDIFKAPRRNVLLRSLVARALARADLVCSTSQAMAGEIRRYAPAVTPAITPFGVDTQHFAPPAGKDAAARAGASLTIGTVRALREGYGLRYLLEAAALLGGDFPELRLLIIGEGPGRAGLEALAGRLGLGERVSFPGFVPQQQLPAQLAQMDIFCMPSLAESFGVAALEAQACGLPVVATRVGGLPEVVADGETGFLVPAADAAALAAQLRRLAADGELRRQMGAAARRRVLRLYNWSDNAAQMERLYSTLIR